MSSISTLLTKRPAALDDPKLFCQKSHYHVGVMSWCLWVLAAIIAGSTAETSSNMTGISVTFKLQDVLMMVMSTILLIKGVSIGNPNFILLWVFISCWNIYTNQYQSLIGTLQKLQTAKRVSSLAWVVFGIDSLGMVIKAVLVLRMAHLAISFWYQRKLQHETMGSI